MAITTGWMQKLRNWSYLTRLFFLALWQGPPCRCTCRCVDIGCARARGHHATVNILAPLLITLTQPNYRRPMGNSSTALSFISHSTKPRSWVSRCNYIEELWRWQDKCHTDRHGRLKKKTLLCCDCSKQVLDHLDFIMCVCGNAICGIIILHEAQVPQCLNATAPRDNWHRTKWKEHLCAVFLAV